MELVRDLFQVEAEGRTMGLLDELDRAAELEVRAHRLVRSLVGDARADGSPWVGIGRRLWRYVPGRGLVKGVTRQAAHARFADD